MIVRIEIWRPLTPLLSRIHWASSRAVLLLPEVGSQCQFEEVAADSPTIRPWAWARWTASPRVEEPNLVSMADT